MGPSLEQGSGGIGCGVRAKFPFRMRNGLAQEISSLILRSFGRTLQLPLLVYSIP
jgi:hypothetical protein